MAIVDIVHYDSTAPSDPLILPLSVPRSQVLSRMVRVANPSHVKAVRLRESGIEWSIALVKAKVPGTDLTRKSVRQIIRELVSTAKAEEGGAA